MEDNKFRIMAKRILLSSKIIILRALLREYGFKWISNRLLYTIKQKIGYFEKKFQMKQYESYLESSNIFNKYQGKSCLEAINNGYINFNIESIEKFYTNLDEDSKKQIVLRADKIKEGIITGFGSVVLDYGYPINWFLNPTNGVEFDKYNHWSKIPDFGDAGDIKLAWEASRFLFVYDLIKAYVITKDNKYISVYIELFEDWYDNNPPEKGVNWKCSQEISIRLLSITTGLYVFSKSFIFNKELIKKYILLIEASLSHIYKNRNYSLKSIKNDHTIVEMFVLYLFGSIFEIKKYSDLGERNFEKEIIEQFYMDGGYKQNSFNYQRLVVQIISIYVNYKKSPIAKKVTDRINAGIEFLNSSIMNEKGEVPNFGPSDSAVIFPFTDDVLNYKTTINLSKFLLNGTTLYDSLKDKEEIFWFYDISKINIKETPKRLTCFEKSGYWYQNFGDWNVFFRAGKVLHRPFHDDMFHIDLWYKGINFLCDMGTYSYNHSLENPEYYISSSAHNTVNVFPSNDFINLSKFMIVNWKEGLVYEYKSASIKGKRTIGINCEHFRNIRLKQNSIFIDDSVKCSENKTIEINYNFDVKGIRAINNNVFEIELKNNELLNLEIKSNQLEKLLIKLNGLTDKNNTEYWLSRTYLTRQKAFNLRIIVESTKEIDIKIKISNR